MPNFSWEPLDFSEALEVVPVEEEAHVSLMHRIRKGQFDVRAVTTQGQTRRRAIA